MRIKFNYEIKKEDKISNYQIIDILLKNRKIQNVDEFLKPKNPLNISLVDFSTSFKDELTKALKILTEIKEKNQMVVVYTDYDADGITGGAILWETLFLLGFKVMPYVPNRKTEGYGFSIFGIDNVIKKFNPALIISVDHGITKVKEVDYAKEKGIKIIITDHHLKGETIPKAEAIFHIPSLSGAGVSYFFSKEIYKNLKTQISKLKILENNFSSDYLVFASIGTVADLVPLIGPSRSVVKYGLENFSKTRRVGIKHILKEAGIEGKKITPYDIGFIIAPRINAVGRLKDATDALRLLCTKKEDRAKMLASYLGEKNRLRQDLVEKTVEKAKQIVDKEINLFKKLPKIVILKSEDWHEGIIGLIAAKMVEAFFRPTIVLTKNDGFYKASARSIPNFDITAFLKKLKSFLVDVGGHRQAAGFTIKEQKIESFKKEALKLADQLIKDEDLEKEVLVDLKIPLQKINLHWVKLLESLYPFGIGNPEPLFFSEVKISHLYFVGKENKHLKIFVQDENHPSTLELIAFNQADIFKNLYRNQKIKVVYTLSIDSWGGQKTVRGKLITWVTDGIGSTVSSRVKRVITDS
jgi:single-stranded-DNA-specific exonuclease